jgi:hypothetical protein
MMTKAIKKKDIYLTIQYLVILFIILDCNSVYRAAYFNFGIPEICAILIGLLLITNVWLYGLNIRIVKLWGKIFVPYYFAMLLFLFVSVPAESIFAFLVRFFIVLPVLSYVLCIDKYKGDQYSLLLKISSVMTLLALLSILFWVFGPQLHILRPNMSISAYWGGSYTYQGYFGLLFERQYSDFYGTRIYRNQSIFAEGPMYSLCLVFALCIEVFLKSSISKNKFRIGEISFGKKISRRNGRIILLIASILSTTTTTGIILIVVVFTLSFLRKKPRDQIIKILKFLGSVVAVVICAFISYNLFAEKSTSHSWSVRYLDFVYGFTAWKYSPIFGTGYGDFMKANLVAGVTKQGFSNSIMAVLSQGGIVLFAVYIIPFITGGMVAAKDKNSGLILFLIIALLEFIFTLFPYTFLLLFILALFYAETIVTRSESNKSK